MEIILGETIDIAPFTHEDEDSSRLRLEGGALLIFFFPLSKEIIESDDLYFFSTLSDADGDDTLSPFTWAEVTVFFYTPKNSKKEILLRSFHPLVLQFSIVDCVN